MKSFLFFPAVVVTWIAWVIWTVFMLSVMLPMWALGFLVRCYTIAFMSGWIRAEAKMDELWHKSQGLKDKNAHKDYVG